MLAACWPLKISQQVDVCEVVSELLPEVTGSANALSFAGIQQHRAWKETCWNSYRRSAELNRGIFV